MSLNFYLVYTAKMFPLPKLDRKTCIADPDIAQFKWKDLDIGRGRFRAVYLTRFVEKSYSSFSIPHIFHILHFPYSSFSILRIPPHSAAFHTPPHSAEPACTRTSLTFGSFEVCLAAGISRKCQTTQSHWDMCTDDRFWVENKTCLSVIRAFLARFHGNQIIQVFVLYSFWSTGKAS